MQNHNKWSSIDVIFQYVVYEEFSDLTLKFHDNPRRYGKVFFEASNKTLFYEVFLSKMKYFCQRRYFSLGKSRAIFYGSYLIEYAMCRGDLTCRIISDASSTEILQFCNVRK